MSIIFPVAYVIFVLVDNVKSLEWVIEDWHKLVVYDGFQLTLNFQ